MISPSDMTPALRAARPPRDGELHVPVVVNESMHPIPDI